jgi:hypothetical protein
MTSDREERGPFRPKSEYGKVPYPPNVIARPSPSEWLQGDSMIAWFLGDWVLLAASYGAGITLADVLVPVGSGSLALRIIVQLALMSAIALPAIVLYFLAVPCPRNVVVSPEGLDIDFGLRRKKYPWGNVHLRETDVYLYGEWLGVPTRVALNPYQRQRIEAWGRTYAPP